jgi:hypothetical protein
MERDIAALTSDRCDRSGIYWSSGCGHVEALSFKDGDQFPPCITCGKPVRWMIQQIFLLHSGGKPAKREKQISRKGGNPGT